MASRCLLASRVYVVGAEYIREDRASTPHITPSYQACVGISYRNNRECNGEIGQTVEEKSISIFW